jgi:hypothetical protein
MAPAHCVSRSRWTHLSLLAIATLLILPAAAQAADRSFTMRFSATDAGDVAIVANASMTCLPSAAASCAPAQAGIGAPGQLNNNEYAMEYVDVDSDPTTDSSSRADLSLPPGATVLFAGLYWGGESTEADRGSVRLDTPAPDGYVALNGSTLDTASIDNTIYQGFVDVTPHVRSAGSGTYTVADVRGTPASKYGSVPSQNSWAGWSLVVAYRDAAAPRRNLTVFDGLQTVSTLKPNLAIPLSGFTTPASGPVSAGIGVVGYDGDRGLVGDAVRLNGTNLSDALNPPDNVFNSSITRGGTAIAAKQPNYVNHLGFDADVLTADGILAPGSTSATLALATGNENYHPGVVTLVADSTRPISGGPTVPGNRAAPEYCQQVLRGARFRRVRLRGVGRVYVRLRANAVVTPSKPAFVTVEAPKGSLRAVRYVLNGRRLRGSRRSPYTLVLRPRLLRGSTSHVLTVRLVSRRGRSRTVTLPLRSTQCHTIFVAAQRRTRTGSRLTLRVDSLRSLSRVRFSVPSRMLPKRVRKVRTGRLGLRIAGGARNVYRLSFRGSRNRGVLLRASGGPQVLLGRRNVTVTGLPAGTGIIELVLLTRNATRPNALVAPGRSVRLRARVEGEGTVEVLTRRLRGPRR